MVRVSQVVGNAFHVTKRLKTRGGRTKVSWLNLSYSGVFSRESPVENKTLTDHKETREFEPIVNSQFINGFCYKNLFDVYEPIITGL